MSRQQTYAPDEPEEAKPKSKVKVKKDKPWVLWERWNKWGPEQKMGKWHSIGRYGTQAEAEKVMAHRKRQNVVMHPLTWRSTKLVAWERDRSFVVLRDKDGRPS